MKNLQVFRNDELGQVRTRMEEDNFWFCLKDVCNILGLQNSTVVGQRLDPDERAKFNLGRQGNATFINESGLYSVILRSDKPNAKKFKKWVTSEVLPSIRKTGKYEVKSKPQLPVKVPTVPMFQKYNFRGERVMTHGQLTNLLGTNRSSVYYQLYCIGKEPRTLRYVELREFKVENPSIPWQVSHTAILNYFEAVRVAKRLNANQSQLDYLDEYFEINKIAHSHTNLTIEEKYIAITQAELLIRLGRETADTFRRNMMLQRATDIIMAIGIYDGQNGATTEWDYETVEGHNKRAAIANAKWFITQHGADPTSEYVDSQINKALLATKHAI